jgi:type VI protein secretion system component VasF
MRQEVPIWLVAIVIGLVVLVIGILAYRHFMQTPTTQVGGEQE